MCPHGQQAQPLPWARALSCSSPLLESHATRRWQAHATNSLCFVHTAILYESVTIVPVSYTRTPRPRESGLPKVTEPVGSRVGISHQLCQPPRLELSSHHTGLPGQGREEGSGHSLGKMAGDWATKDGSF